MSRAGRKVPAAEVWGAEVLASSRGAAEGGLRGRGGARSLRPVLRGGAQSALPTRAKGTNTRGRSCLQPALEGQACTLLDEMPLCPEALVAPTGSAQGGWFRGQLSPGRSSDSPSLPGVFSPLRWR